VRSQVQRAFSPALVATFVAALALVGVVAVAAEALDKPFGFFSREPSEVLDAPFYTGFLFHIGLLIWFTSAVVCLFGGMLIVERAGRDAALPVLAAGVLSLVLSLDDALRVHEDVLPGKLGIPKAGGYALYGLAVVGWLATFRSFVRRSDWPLLALAVALLGCSVVLDRAFVEHQRHVFEDGAKFLGIVAWTLYFVRTTHARVRTAIDVPP
jgi:hypothetical protein